MLEQVAGGLAWEAIIEEWNGNITEAIAEAVQLATRALLEHVDDFILELGTIPTALRAGMLDSLTTPAGAVPSLSLCLDGATRCAPFSAS